MSEHKGQHYITENYQRNFADASGKIWVLDEDDKIFRANPKNIFKEKYFYNVTFADFPKPLFVEKSLADMEGGFAGVVREKINNLRPLTREDKIAISLFASAMLIRTKNQRETLRDFFKKSLEMVKRIKSDPKQVEFLKSLPVSYSKSGFSQGELENIVENFDSWHSVMTLDGMFDSAPDVFKIKWTFFVAPQGRMFMSSDSPLQMVSPEREQKYGVNAIGSLAGLGHADTELTLPISAKVALLASWKYDKSGYVPATDKQVEQLNYRTARSAKRLFADNREILERMLKKNGRSGSARN